MSETVTSKPAILIDLKKHRIRIHKHTLHMLGNPKYIYLLVNPTDQVIAVCCSTKKDHLSHFINWKSLVNRKSYELYSMNLVQSLRDVCKDWQDNQSYRIYGEIIPNERVAQFHMTESILVNGTQD